MPPVRKGSKTVDDTILDGKILKPMKTVRTHEENQERAYVAASRRSDRSLEARIESARRASEIHKKRTGRAFRITEEDVLNEQYYEEVDDDIPASFRRLQMHLNGLYHWNNPRFDSYMISNYAKTHAAMFAQRFGQQGNSQYANPPIFSNSFGQGAQGVPQAGSSNSPTISSATQGENAQQHQAHQRSASIAVSQSEYPASTAPFGVTDGQNGNEDQRRFSHPGHPVTAENLLQNRPTLSRTSSGSDNSGVTKDKSQQHFQFNAGTPQLNMNSPPTSSLSMNTTCQPQQTNGYDGMTNSPNSMPLFSPSVPLNVAQFWDTTAQMPNFFSADASMGYQYNPNAHTLKTHDAASHNFNNQGIHQTLTGNAFTGMPDQKFGANPSPTSPSVQDSSNQPFDAYWGTSDAAGLNMGTEFEGLFDFSAGDDRATNNFLDEFMVNDDVHASGGGSNAVE